MGEINKIGDFGLPVGYWDGEYDENYFKGIFSKFSFSGFIFMKNNSDDLLQLPHGRYVRDWLDFGFAYEIYNDHPESSNVYFSLNFH